jgi:hypothetical protein
VLALLRGCDYFHFHRYVYQRPRIWQ